MKPCPRCGHNNPKDISRREDGDHLIRVEGPLEMSAEPSTKDDTIMYRAEMNVEFKWCSEVYK